MFCDLSYGALEFKGAVIPQLFDNGDALFLFQAADDVYQLMKQEDPTLFRMVASSNGVSTAGLFNLPTIVCGPGDLELAHSANEYCSIQSFLDGCRIYAALCLGNWTT